MISESQYREFEYVNAKGCCGEEFAKVFCAIIDKMRKLVNPKSVIANPESIALPDFNCEQSALYMLTLAVANLFAEGSAYRNTEFLDSAFLFCDRLPNVFQRVFCDKLVSIYPESSHHNYMMRRRVSDASEINAF
jgi:hypothetical protein